MVQNCSLRTQKVSLGGSSQNLLTGLVKDESTLYLSALITMTEKLDLFTETTYTFEDFNP